MVTGSGATESIALSLPVPSFTNRWLHAHMPTYSHARMFVWSRKRVLTKANLESGAPPTDAWSVVLFVVVVVTVYQRDSARVRFAWARRVQLEPVPVLVGSSSVPVLRFIAAQCGVARWGGHDGPREH